MFQSVIVKRMNNALIPPPRLRALSRPRRRCHVYVLSCLRVVMLSVRTHSGCSVSMLIDRKIACNRGKEFCNSNYVSSLVDTRSDRHVRSENVSRQIECQSKVYSLHL